MTARVLASTTSHKREPLPGTLEVFAQLGLTDVDLNLHHVIEEGLSVEEVASAVDSCGVQVRVASGGWCDFFHRPPLVAETFRSVDRQVAIADRLGARMLRLFFGRQSRQACDQASIDVIAGNLRRLSDTYPAMTFVFENHDGASLVPEICRNVLDRVDRPNIRMNFDPINFERAGVKAEAALACVAPLISHVHLKGLERGDYCAFGSGDVDLAPVLEALTGRGYCGDFTVEYEGPGDATSELYESVRRARASVASLHNSGQPGLARDLKIV